MPFSSGLAFSRFHMGWFCFFLLLFLLTFGGDTERKGRCRGKVIRASLFGVGAPEALVIGVVALLVFGPKGLAEVSCVTYLLLFKEFI